MDSYLTIEEKHNRDNYNLNWSQNSHYFNHINCGYSCPCCLAKIQKQTGNYQFGACKICLNHN